MGPTNTDGRRVRFKAWQWAEIYALMVLIAAQLALQFSGHIVIALILGALLLAVMAHIYLWIIPMVRARKRQ